MQGDSERSGTGVIDHLSKAFQNGLVNSAFDRDVQRRDDPDWVVQQLNDVNSRFIPVWRQKNLIDVDEMKAMALSPTDIAQPETLLDSTVLLGSHERRTYFAFFMDENCDPIGEKFLHTDATFEDLRRVGPMLDDWDASLLAYAKGICFWHERHRFCGVCGSPTVSSKAGHLRRCADSVCGASHFPRTDPAIIVLVHCEEHCLLGRQGRWPEGVYSTLAGFVEPGESAEQAVLREVWEETGIRIEQMWYQSSQPWPFPSSLMLGFEAQARFDNICRNDDELEDARWFTREQVIDALADRGALRLPPQFSISRRLIEGWCR